MTGPVAKPTADLLATIVAATRRLVEVRRKRESIEALATRAAAHVAQPDRLFQALSRPGFNIIAECKRRSPSKGVLRAEYDAPSIARAYQHAGAAAISVLTEPTFFDGALEHLEGASAAVAIPILRKDFIVSEYQILEARAAGASAILLIVAALTPGELSRLAAFAATQKLDVLVEVHDEEELDVAIAAGARLIGVNNRNLRTLDVDIAASERLIGRMPPGVVGVSESGLRTGEDLVRLADLGYRAFLIGERFMTDPNPGDGLRALLTQAQHTSAATASGAERGPRP
ncbi:MAG: indole-3-glycerol phosphate synthase TrpC [Vicinamibacterales bacterium]